MTLVTDRPARPAGIPGSGLSGPFPVGLYAARLREQLRGFARVQVFGEVVGFKAGRAKVWFELRDASGALPCSMWAKDFEALGLGELADGQQVVAAGGCDFYPGSRASSPAFSFTVTDVRVAGEGDLLAQLERLRRALHAEGLFSLQKRLPRVALPRTIGVVCGEHGKARDDDHLDLLERRQVRQRAGDRRRGAAVLHRRERPHDAARPPAPLQPREHVAARSAALAGDHADAARQRRPRQALLRLEQPLAGQPPAQRVELGEQVTVACDPEAGDVERERRRRRTRAGVVVGAAGDDDLRAVGQRVGRQPQLVERVAPHRARQRARRVAQL